MPWPTRDLDTSPGHMRSNIPDATKASRADRYTVFSLVRVPPNAPGKTACLMGLSGVGSGEPRRKMNVV